MQKKGSLINIEGIDGSGKTLLMQNLQKFFKNNPDIIFTKEPGDTEIGKKLRKILQEKKHDHCDLTEFLLFAADRAQHFKQVIIPALNQGKVIISDRLADSSVAYQGYGRGVDIKMIKTVNDWTMQKTKPDLTLYIQIDTNTALQRICKRNKALTSFEKEKMDFWKKVINGYKEIFGKRDNVLFLDGKKTPEQVCANAVEAVLKKVDPESSLRQGYVGQASSG